MNIFGKLRKNAEVQILSQEKQMVNFSITINDSYLNKKRDRIKQTAFFDCLWE